MKADRKEEIIMATLELAAQHGLGNVSMSMIADRVGIKKPSLYNHFASKEDILEAMYTYLRKKAKENSNIGVTDYSTLFSGRTALEVLTLVVNNYIRLNNDKNMNDFYRVIFSERCISKAAARIIAEETETMILVTKQLFYAMQVHRLLSFGNPNQSAVSFAMTVHGILDYMKDADFAENAEGKMKPDTLMRDYLEWFCRENAASASEE